MSFKSMILCLNINMLLDKIPSHWKTFTLRPMFYLLIKMNSKQCWSLLYQKLANIHLFNIKDLYLNSLFSIS